jgi:hypothetical protein
MRSFWAKWWEKSFRIKNPLLIQSNIIEEMRIESKVNSRNSWEASFFKGLAADMQALNWMSINDPSLILSL